VRERSLDRAALDSSDGTGLVFAERSAFEYLCVLASREQWCWKVGCTTCGHGVFRWAFRALAAGRHPLDATWSVHWGRGATSTRLAARNGPLPPSGGWPLAEQERLQRIVARATVANIARETRFPDWLGYLGLALLYTEAAEQRDRVLTQALVPQLRELVLEQSPGACLLDELVNPEGQRLDWRQLETIEHSWRHEV
jgi:hypothetical protein